MHFTNVCAFILASISACNTLAAPVLTVHPGGVNDIVITSANTVNATKPPPTKPRSAPSIKSLAQLPISIVNNFPGGSINAYVTGLDATDQLVMLSPSGEFYYPTASESESTPQAITANVAIPMGPQGSTTNITLPGYISSARIWLAEGDLQFFTVYTGSNNGPSLVEPSAVNPSDPSADVNWGFVELTNTEDGGLFANISYVDFVGLILGMRLTCGDGPAQTAQGLSSNAVATICSSLETQAAVDGQPWGDLCLVDSAGTPLRVISPDDYISINPTAFEQYWDTYVEQVWTTYTTTNLTIDTQGAAGNVSCQVQGGELLCEGDNRGYSQPTASDIFGCNSGPFGILAGDNYVHQAIVPRLCAAFTRTTLLMEGGNVQPALAATNYYSTSPTSWYSKFVHENEMDGKGYAFSYDDVTPDAAINQSGVVADSDPELLTITVGGPVSSGWS